MVNSLHVLLEATKHLSGHNNAKRATLVWLLLEVMEMQDILDVNAEQIMEHDKQVLELFIFLVDVVHFVFEFDNFGLVRGVDRVLLLVVVGHRDGKLADLLLLFLNLSVNLLFDFLQVVIAVIVFVEEAVVVAAEVKPGPELIVRSLWTSNSWLHWHFPYSAHTFI